MLNIPPRIFFRRDSSPPRRQIPNGRAVKVPRKRLFFFITIIYIPILTSSVSHHYNSVTTAKEWL